MARKILLADDSVTAQNMGRKILADAGYDVATVNNGSAALKRIADLKPDLIVLDVYMPGYSGLEVCQRLKDSEETAHIPVLLSVGKLEPFKPEEARRVRADAHIVKPFEASELLTAITRLEDLLVTQPSNGLRGGGMDSGPERFRSAGNGKKSETNAAADSGWKSRLGLSPKKKKDEKDEVDDAATGAFRDFRKGKRNGAGEVKKVKQATGQEPVPVTDIPDDITPDELDALSALAAKLEGPISSTESVAPPEDETAQQKTVASTEASAVEAVGTMVVESVVPEASVPEASVPEAVVAEAALPEVQSVSEPAVVGLAVEAQIPEFPIVEDPVSAVEGKSEIEIPVEQVELSTEVSNEDFGMIAGATNAAKEAAVEMDQRATEPVTNEYSDYPPAENQPAENQREENQREENQPLSTFPPEIGATVNAALFAEEPACVDRDDEPMFATAASAMEPAAEEPAAEEPAAEEPAPSDAELVQALRLLTPANWNADTSAMQSEAIDRLGEVAAGNEASDKESSQQSSSLPRWVAELVALGADEAALSLEAEMFSTLAAMPTAAPCDALEAAGITGVAAIEAAVEHTLASADLSAGIFASALPEALPEALQGIQVEHPADEQNLALQDSAHHHQDENQGPEGKVEETSVADEHGAYERGADENEAKTDSATVTPAVTMTAVTMTGQADPGEAAKSERHDSDEVPKAKAAVAAAEGGESASATDASTIASIVDRVMADLRPKIVEEITKKLGGK